jgi:hypothetical protein
MAETKFLKCPCDHCGGHIEFPADGIGATIPCPHCARPTELALEIPAELIQRPAHGRKWFIAGAVILAVGGIAIAAILFKAQQLTNKTREKNEALRRSVLPATRTNAAARNNAQSSPAKIINGFFSSPVAIDQAVGSSLAYATGTLKNETDKQRFGVSVELEVFDRAGTRIGIAKDSAQIMEPRGVWNFRALIVPKNAVSAKVLSVKEQE